MSIAIGLRARLELSRHDDLVAAGARMTGALPEEVL